MGHASFSALLINTCVYVHVCMCMYIKICIHIYITSFLGIPQCHPVTLTFKSSLWSEKYSNLSARRASEEVLTGLLLSVEVLGLCCSLYRAKPDLALAGLMLSPGRVQSLDFYLPINFAVIPLKLIQLPVGN